MIVHECEQLSEEWFALHLGRPSASQFHRFITPARGSYSAQAKGYIADLLVDEIEGRQGGFISADMERGILMEDEARSWYELRFDCDVQQVGAIENKGAIYSPDGLVGEPGAVEFKVPKTSTHIKWLLNGSLPDEHKIQCHAALLVAELEWIDFVSYSYVVKPLVVRVTPSDYTVKVGEALDKFLEQYETAKKKVLG